VATKALSDSRGVFHGLVASGRDITEMVSAAGKYKKIRYRMIPLLLIAVIGVLAFYGYKLLRGSQPSSQSEKILRAIMARDYLFLSSLLVQPLKEDNMEAAGKIVHDFARTDPEESPYRGFVLLDSGKKARYALMRDKASEDTDLIGSSYAGILINPRDSAHTVLTLYRVTRHNPMGKRSVEVAFVIRSAGIETGWIVFVMDMALVRDKFNLDEKDLKAMQFETIER
jgi:hypothetical protein